MQIVQYNLKLYNVYFKCVWQNLDFLHKRSLVLNWPLFHFLVCLQSAIPKRAAILFNKKVVPLNFGFCSLGNEYNFLSNQKTGKI